MFGLSFNFNTFGKAKFTTTFGGVITFITLSIISYFSYFFGTDLFYKKNPTVVLNDLVNLTTKRVELRNDINTFFFRLQNGSSQPYSIGDIPYKVRAMYFHLRKNKQRQFEQVCSTWQFDIVTKCSNTDATKNPYLSKEKLEEWLCWDFEKVKEICRKQLGDKEPDYLPTLGGKHDEEEYSAIRLDVLNHIYDPEKNELTNVVPKAEMDKWNGQVLLQIRYPSASYDASLPDDPLQVFYDSTLIYIMNSVFNRQLRFMKLVTSIDDSGWLFPQISKKSVMAPERTDLEYATHDLANYGPQVYYNGFFWNVKIEKEYKRNFMKLQNLSALVSGMAKSIIVAFGILALYNATKERDDEIRRKFFNVKSTKTANASQLPLQNETTKVNTVVNLTSQARDEATNISVWSYWFRFCRRSTEYAKKIRIFEQMREHIYERMDVEPIFKVFVQFSMVKEMLLSEEQKELLENQRTEVEVEAKLNN